MTSDPCLRRPTTSVLLAVALVGGAILLLGDRFESAPSYALTQPVRAEGAVGACVAEENMRLIALDRERCQPGELALTSEQPVRAGASGRPEVAPAGPPGPPGPAVCVTLR